MSVIRSCVVAGCKVRTELPVDAYACADCQKRLVRKLAEIETYLTIVNPNPVHIGQEPHAKGYESTPPLRLDVVAMLDPRTEINGSSGATYEDGIDHDELDEIPNIGADLGGWYRVLVEEHPDWEGARVGAWDGWALDVADVLRSRCDWVARQPWVDEFAADVGRVHSALRRACLDLPPDPVGECIALLSDGECRGDVYATRDHDGVKCSRCGRLYYGNDLVRLHVAQRGSAA